MSQALSKWRCDKCGGSVTVEEGYVNWEHENPSRKEIRIIHQARCDDGAYNSSAALADFLGPDGLVKLTAMLSSGTLVAHRYEDSASVPAEFLPNLDIWVDFVRRVQIPYYEEARELMRDAELREYLSDSNEVAPYLQRSLKQIIDGVWKRR